MIPRCLWGFSLKSAYVNGIRKISELKRGQVVRLIGSGAAVVEEIWTVGEGYFGRFRCQDGLVVLLTEAEEAMIGTLTRLSEGPIGLGTVVWTQPWPQSICRHRRSRRDWR